MLAQSRKAYPGVPGGVPGVPGGFRVFWVEFRLLQTPMHMCTLS